MEYARSMRPLGLLQLQESTTGGAGGAVPICQ